MVNRRITELTEIPPDDIQNLDLLVLARDLDSGVSAAGSNFSATVEKLRQAIFTWRVLNETDFSSAAASSVDVNIEGYSDILVQLNSVVTGAGDIRLRVSIDGGSTFESTNQYRSIESSESTSNSRLLNGILIGFQNSTNNSVLMLKAPRQSGIPTQYQGISSNTNPFTVVIGGFTLTTARLTDIRLLNGSSNNFTSGTFRVLGR